MAHGKNARQHNGKEWWGKRPLSGTSVSAKHGMKKQKRRLHKIERRLNMKVWTKEEVEANRSKAYRYVI